MGAAAGKPRSAVDDVPDTSAGGERTTTSHSIVETPVLPGTGASRSGRRRPPRRARTPEFDPRDRDHDLEPALVAMGLHFAERADREVAAQLCEVIAERHELLVPTTVLSDNRHPDVVAARRELCGVLRAMGWSLTRIGRAVGREHTSVMNLLKERT